MKALLLLTGGRIIPDVLLVQYLQPGDIAFNVTTKQGLAVAKKLKEIAHAKLGCEIEIQPIIDPYSESEIKEACRAVLRKRTDVEWIISITSAPKIVSIFAMDIAREENIPCWFLNTDDAEVISLARDIPVDNEKLFNISVDLYIEACRDEYNIRENKRYRTLAESWYDVARLLAYAPEETHLFVKALREAQKGRSEKDSVSMVVTAQAKKLVYELQSYGMLTIDAETTDTVQCTLIDGQKRKFLCGTWLEIYVYKEIEKSGFATDCQWGYDLAKGRIRGGEIDVAFTYRGLLLVAECKTDSDPFTGTRDIYLDTFSTVAHSLGQGYVSKFFITSHPAPETVDSYLSFSEQARQRSILIINGKQLRDIGALLREQAQKPFYERQ